MATERLATECGTGVQARTAGTGFVSKTSKYTLTAALIADEELHMLKVPAGAVIQEVILSCDDLDDATALCLDVGDDGDDNRFIAASTVGQAGGLVRLSTHGGHGYQYSAETEIIVSVQTAPGTGTYSNKSITLTVMYTMHDDV